MGGGLRRSGRQDRAVAIAVLTHMAGRRIVGEAIPRRTLAIRIRPRHRAPISVPYREAAIRTLGSR